MIGPEHYREAERLLADAESLTPGSVLDRNSFAAVERAQVHATLALAAASAMYALPVGRETFDSWSEVTS